MKIEHPLKSKITTLVITGETNNIDNHTVCINVFSNTMVGRWGLLQLQWQWCALDMRDRMLPSLFTLSLNLKCFFVSPVSYTKYKVHSFLCYSAHRLVNRCIRLFPLGINAKWAKTFWPGICSRLTDVVFHTSYHNVNRIRNRRKDILKYLWSSTSFYTSRR